MHQLTDIQRVVVWALPVLFAITVHEVAHGWVARRLGDPTAMMLGRLTLNPLKHIDPIGTVILPLFMMFVGGFIFGWAKPVPITYQNLHHPKRDMIYVAIAGPAANLIMAILWAIVLKISLVLSTTNSNLYWVFQPLIYMGGAGIYINVILMVLNLLPIPPLDGGRVVTGLLPGPLSYKFSQIEPFGLVILIALLVTGILGKVLFPVVLLFITLISNSLGVMPVMQYLF
jgi:Zn-dependent protease